MLGLLLARLNFGLMFGRFALDAEHQAIWFDETLLGDQFSDEELRFTIQVVATISWPERSPQAGPRRSGGPFSSTTLPSGSRRYIEGP